jgi:hypothetical protein
MSQLGNRRTEDFVDGSVMHPSGVAMPSGSTIPYQPAGVCAVASDVQSKLREFVSVKDFGADPTGQTDSHQAIINALNASEKIYFPPGNYVSSSSIVVRDRDVEIEGNGASLTFTTGFLDLGGSIGSAFTLSANAGYGANVFTVSGGGFTAGDVMQLLDTDDFSHSLHRPNYRKGQLFAVLAADGNVLTTAENSLATWTTGANISVKKISPVKVTIRNLNVFASEDVGSTTCRIIYSKDIYIENCSFKGGDQSAIRISYSKRAAVKGSSCICEAPVTSGLQYGISIDDSENILIHGCELYGTRHATGLGGSGTTGTKFVVVDSCTLSNDQQLGIYSADIHGNCSYITYQNNTIFGGASIAGEYAQYLGNKIFAPNTATFRPAINYTEIVGGNFTIDGNDIYMPAGNNAIAAINTTASSFWTKINYNYHFQVTNNEFGLNSGQVSAMLVGTHYLAPSVQPSVTWENNKFRNNCSGLVRVIQLASIRENVGDSYVQATGPFVTKDFTRHITMPETVALFESTQGSVATNAVRTAIVGAGLAYDNTNLTLTGTGRQFGLGTATPRSRLDFGTGFNESQMSWHNNATTSYGHIGIQNNSGAIGLMQGLRFGAAANSFESSISGAWAKSGLLVDFGRLRFYSNPSDTVAYGTTITPTERFRIGSSGEAFFPTIGTTAAAANAFLDSGTSPANSLLRSTSSIRYKTDVETINAQYADNILNLRPVWYRSLAQADKKDWSWYGLIAEEVAIVEPRLVHWSYPEDAYQDISIEVLRERTVVDDEGNETVEQYTDIETEKQLKPDAEKIPDGVQYDRLAVLLLDVVKRQQADIEQLKADIALLKISQ